MHVLVGSKTCNSVKLLMTITFTNSSFVPAFCRVMLDSDNILVRTFPGVSADKAVETDTNSEDTTVQVEEPSTNRDPVLNSSYCNPRRPSSPPRPLSKIQRLPKNKTAFLANKITKRKLKKNMKVFPCNKRFRKLCQVSCNKTKTFCDHVNSRSHPTRLENKKSALQCIPCSKTLETHNHLLRHINAVAHQKVVIKQNN